MAGARAQHGKDAVYAGCALEPSAGSSLATRESLAGERLFRLGEVGLAPFFWSTNSGSLLFLVFGQRLLSQRELLS
jgi:hypothetical protein